MKFKNAGVARQAGYLYSVHKLNQPDPQDNGWHYFSTRQEATDWEASHPDPLNPTAPKVERMKG